MMKIHVLGTGCPKCRKMAENAETAARSLGLDFKLEKITDINKILEFGVMITPALVVNGEIKVTGKVPTPEEIEAMLG